MQETQVQSISGRSPRKLQYSCLQDSMDKGDWRATVRGVAKGSDMPEQLTLSDFEFIKTIFFNFVALSKHNKPFCFFCFTLTCAGGIV